MRNTIEKKSTKIDNLKFIIKQKYKKKSFRNYDNKK